MDTSRLQRVSDVEWHIAPHGRMRVPGVIYASRALIEGMDDKVGEQVANVAALPGIVQASYAMPDAHWGYGFAIGGVAAFDADAGGVVSAGGVGFDISCGVRALHTGLQREAIGAQQERLADALYAAIPAGLGSTGRIRLGDADLDAMLSGGARWAVASGWGEARDLERIEEHGCMSGADPAAVSAQARRRQRDEMGTLGSGNHYLEVQVVNRIFDREAAMVFDLHENDVVISIHCGSRGLGHQIGTEYLKLMLLAAQKHGINLPERELACAPIHSDTGRAYLGAMRAGINCALANRQILTHLVREVFASLYPGAVVTLLYDVSHNTCKQETHSVGGRPRSLFVHRKGATRALGPGHPELPARYAAVGQPVLLPGDMGTASYVLKGTARVMAETFASAAHGAGRAMSRTQAKKAARGRDLRAELAAQQVTVRAASGKTLAEEMPEAYKDVERVVGVMHGAGIATLVAKTKPLAVIKG
jgi:tRNA-splicing ligase RtcB (3'-phosphate/5'-hydroxy nucleic acid ligase)